MKFEFGDPVSYRAANVRQGKLDQKWKLYYRKVAETKPVTFEISDQLRYHVKRVHANEQQSRNVIFLWSQRENQQGM